MPASYQIFVDSNAAELPVYKCIQDRIVNPATVTVARQDIGDIVIECSNNTKVILERKTFADLCGSLRRTSDGCRYSDQRARLLAARDASPDNVFIGYIIDQSSVPPWGGDIGGVHRANAHQALAATQFDGVAVHWANGAADIAHIVLYLAEKAAAGSLSMDARLAAFKSKGGWAATVVGSNKRKNRDASAGMVPMLSTVPGCTTVTAEAICKLYPSMAALVAAFTAAGEEASTVLRGIQLAKNRKLGPKLSEDVWKAVTAT